MNVPKKTNSKKRRRKGKKKIVSLEEKQALHLKFLQHNLQKEVGMRDRVIKDIDKFWKDFLVYIKLPILQENAQILRNSLECTIDKKNAYIMKLYTEIEEQHRYKLSWFIGYIQDHICYFKVFIDGMNSDYENELKTILERGKFELSCITDYFNQHKQKMTILNTIENENKLKFNDGLHGLTEIEISYTTNEFDERYEIMQNKMKSLQDNISKECKSLLKKHNKKIESKKKIFDEMEAKENKSLKIIKQLNKAIRKNKNSVCKLRKEFSECEIRFNRVYQDKTDLYNEKIKRNDERTIDQEKFYHLVECSDDTLKKLNALSEKVKHIFILNNLCRKYQKDVDIDRYSPTNKYLLLLNEKFDELERPEYKMMEKNWARVVKAQAENKMLIEEKNKLMKENEMLRNKVKKTLTKTTTENKYDGNEVPKGPPCVVDASMISKKYK